MAMVPALEVGRNWVESFWSLEFGQLALWAEGFQVGDGFVQRAGMVFDVLSSLNIQKSCREIGHPRFGN